MDFAKYRGLFLEEAREHLGELAGALLELEKDPCRSEAIDVAFRMAHSIKGMAASLEYDGVTRLAHRLEDRIATFRAAGAVEVPDGMVLLFRGLEALEGMVSVLRDGGESPAPDEALLAALAGSPSTDRGTAKKA